MSSPLVRGPLEFLHFSLLHLIAASPSIRLACFDFFRCISSSSSCVNARWVTGRRRERRQGAPLAIPELALSDLIVEKSMSSHSISVGLRAVVLQQETWKRVALELSGAKIALADNAYDLVEDVTRQLDEERRRLEQALPRSERHRAEEEEGEGEGEEESPMDVDVDPEEPLYCHCRQVAFGNMIACDNPACPIEWYHYAWCVEGVGDKQMIVWVDG